MERAFLGWSKPLLHLAADYLLANHTVDGRLDLRNVSLVLPGRRAVNRLEEILAERAATLPDPAWYPPEFLTPDSLPEQFYEMKKPVADDVTQWFGWMEAVDRLRIEDKASLDRLLPKTPDRFEARLAFGRMLARLHYELAAEGIDFLKVAATCKEIGVDSEVPRWKALARLQECYAKDDSANPGFLDKLGLWDLQSARLFAIDRQSPEEFNRIRQKLTDEKKKFYLVGLVDMNRLQKGILKKFSSFITALIFAPKDDKKLQARFDEFGCLVADAWSDAFVEIDDDRIEIAWQPEHQADAVLRKIASFGGEYSTGEIVVGVQDKEVVPFVQQRLRQGELPSRLVVGTPIRRTAVYRFLEVLLKYLKSRRFRDFAELVRHPDVERFLKENVPEAKLADLLTLLDEYYNQFLPLTLDGPWKSTVKESFTALQKIGTLLHELLGLPLFGEESVPLPLERRFEALETALDRLFGDHQNKQSRDAVDVVRQQLEALRSLPVGLPEMFDDSESLEILLTQLETAHVPPAEVSNAIELIGWLDLAMDDAPAVIVTGMNDGTIPSFANSDIFLPDALRQRLGIMDNRRRSARDLYALTVLLESHRNDGVVYLIGGRRSVAGDSVLPSRFFFASENNEKVARRVRSFFDEMKPEPRVRLKRSLHPGQQKEHAFRIPELPEPAQPIEAVGVTELSGYLQCPYRYYLARQLYLRRIDDLAEELPSFEFGNILHEVLRRFGEKKSSVRNSRNVEEIRDFLLTQVNDYAVNRFGRNPRATIAIQIERTKARLSGFATWQAAWRRDGYEIEDVEYSPDKNHPPLLAGALLKGRIDRIDRNKAKKEIVVLDYKTSNSDPDPEKVHRTAAGVWLDFQLPLYQYILRQTGYAAPDETIRLGYINISKKTQSTGQNLTSWTTDDLRDAVEKAEQIVRDLTTRSWKDVRPITPPPKYSQDFAFICQDGIR